MSTPVWRDRHYIDRSVLAIFPERTEKWATFDTGNEGPLTDVASTVVLPVTGWASVLHLNVTSTGPLPHVTVEPIVDEDDYGLITQSDLEAETGWLLREIT